MLDDVLLAAVEHKLQLIRDRTRGVAEGYATGLYLWGPGGTGKSHTVERTLDALGTPYRLTNSRITGRGLFTLLADSPDIVHVLDDVEPLFADKNALGVLRSALWGQQRLVVWHTALGREQVLFTGGLILIGNRCLGDVPELQALATRIAVLHFQPTMQEMAALMRQVARRGFRHGKQELSSADCLEVASAIIDHSARLERHPDMRLLVSTFLDRLQWDAGASETHWLDLLESRLTQRILPTYENRAQRKQRELAILREIQGLCPQERLARWQDATGKSQAALYRLLSQAG